MDNHFEMGLETLRQKLLTMASRTEIMALLPEDRDDDLAYAPMRAAMGAMDTDERE